MKIKRYLNIYLSLITAFFLLSTLGLFSREKDKEEKEVLRWAADAESGAPYVFADPKIPSRLIGFEVDIINEVCDKLGMKGKHVQNQWDGLIPGLKRGDYDIVINGIEITSDRKKVVNFSLPYYLTYQQLVIRSGQKGIQTMSDLVGKKVGTLKASLAERMLRAEGGINVRTYDSEQNSYQDLKNGRLDAVLIDEPVAKYYAGWNPELELVGQPIGEVSYGIVVPKEDTLLLKRINEALREIAQSGRLREILEQWNMWNHMMASYLDDQTESNVAPKKYHRFLESQGKETTLKMLINRYINFMPDVGTAAMVTLSLSILAMVLAVVLGLTIALLRVYAPKPISMLAVLFIEFIRGTPLLIQLFFIFYALPSIGVNLNPFIAGVLGLGINYAAYEAEVYRAGLFSVPRGQMEAAISLGMRRRDALRHIIIPQAIRLVIPPTTNDFISLLKDSSLVAVITLVELTKLYFNLASTYYDYIGTGLIIAAVYLLLGLPFVQMSKHVEKKFSLDKKIEGKR